MLRQVARVIAVVATTNVLYSNAALAAPHGHGGPHGSWRGGH